MTSNSRSGIDVEEDGGWHRGLILDSTSIPDLEGILESFWAHFEYAYLKIALSEADERKLKIEQKAFGFSTISSRSAILERAQFPLKSFPEVNFLKILNCLEIWLILASKMTSKSYLKT